MKKILKSLKRTLLLGEEEETLKNNLADNPEGKCSSTPKEQHIVSVATNESQNETQAVKCEKKYMTTGLEGKVQADEAKCSFKTQPPFHPETKNYSDCRLFLGGLPDNVAEIEVKNVFEKYGKVVHVIIPVEKETNKPKRYGYLEFDNKDSAQACLDDHFVTVCGKKVEVKKAWPRGTARKEVNCNKRQTKETEKLRSRSKDLETVETMTDSSLKSSHSGAESNVEDSQLLYQELFKDYFKAKFFLQNLLEVEVSNVPLTEKIDKRQEISEAEMEKILRGIYVYNEEDNSTEESSEDFFSDSDGTNLIAEQLSSDSTENYEQTRHGQTENTFFSMKGEKRKVCELCKWAPSDNSIESFLVHCETTAHKQKLKERFKKSDIRDETLGQANLKRKTKKVKENQKNKQNRKLKKIRNRKDKSSLDKENQESKSAKLILGEIIASIEAETEKCIKCKLCNKIIPSAPNIRVFMSNMSHHLQSKGHLSKSLGKLQMEQELSKNTPKTVKNVTPTTKQTTNAGVPCKNKTTIQPKRDEYPRVKFRCLTCNYFCRKSDTLLAHLNSAFHSESEKQTSASPLKTDCAESLWNDLINCTRCGTYLYGCSYSIKNHITNCKERK